MKPTLLIQGELTQTNQFLHQLLMADLPIDCVILPEHTDDTPQYQALVVASALCPQLSIRVGTNTDYAQASWLILLDQTVTEQPLVTRVANLRRVTNRILENGFQGQLIFAGEHDDLFTYFAWKYSGAAPHQILGLGTYPLTRLLTCRLAERLGVGPRAIQTTVIGRSATPIAAWSRTYVGPTPILMYLANADAKFGADDLGKMGSWLQREAAAPQTTLRFMVLIRILRSVLMGHPVIVPVAHPQPETPTYATATPVLVSADGWKPLPKLALSEDEQQDYAACVAAIQDDIGQIEGQQTEEN
ncbi:Rossmann-fold NAD(P)-binding domain-containing protein [Levilactobacillus suantsaii]|uniref:Lactate dehydrogenase n=1 Tax=Levilactobacillus suantsaii TaxID=2292255 RepID=A0A4Q0VKI5_9LACO|nr:lactate dehydrogenase [Levilactobacillus suantsaii]QMU07461.1 lactate dehydrogenase [Levilactobacillus suantsaii]RXI79263.1 lactate dehydrogenase [Levilactobacillus suantsaii]